MNEDDIKKEAKEIMDKFMNALSNIEVEEEYNLIRDETFRDEEKPLNLDEEFKNGFLSNAPKTSGDAVLANKGEWTKK